MMSEKEEEVELFNDSAIKINPIIEGMKLGFGVRNDNLGTK